MLATLLLWWLASIAGLTTVTYTWTSPGVCSCCTPTPCCGTGVIPTTLHYTGSGFPSTTTPDMTPFNGTYTLTFTPSLSVSWAPSRVLFDVWYYYPTPSLLIVFGCLGGTLMQCHFEWSGSGRPDYTIAGNSANAVHCGPSPPFDWESDITDSTGTIVLGHVSITL